VELGNVAALVTGGSSGLGLATSHALRERGAEVVMLSRDAVRGREAATATGSVHVAGDITDPDAVVLACQEAATRGPLRAVVLCAGQGHAERTIGRDGTTRRHDLDSFRRVLEVNLVGTFNCLRVAASIMAAAPALADGSRGAIVMASSLAATGGQVGQAAYAAAKAGMLGLLRPIARELAPVGIRLNAILPGGIDTPAFGPEGVDPALRDRIGKATIYPHRMGRPEEFASLAVELLTNEYMNCCAVNLDAGTTLLPR
jgi:NAD(P)-dependent dehydrogenase (short-subunit alcohol dehydrogenase family)